MDRLLTIFLAAYCMVQFSELSTCRGHTPGWEVQRTEVFSCVITVHRYPYMQEQMKATSRKETRQNIQNITKLLEHQRIQLRIQHFYAFVVPCCALGLSFCKIFGVKQSPLKKRPAWMSVDSARLGGASTKGPFHKGNWEAWEGTKEVSHRSCHFQGASYRKNVCFFWFLFQNLPKYFCSEICLFSRSLFNSDVGHRNTNFSLEVLYPDLKGKVSS